MNIKKWLIVFSCLAICSCSRANPCDLVFPEKKLFFDLKSGQSLDQINSVFNSDYSLVKKSCFSGENNYITAVSAGSAEYAGISGDVTLVFFGDNLYSTDFLVSSKEEAENVATFFRKNNSGDGVFLYENFVDKKNKFVVSATDEVLMRESFKEGRVSEFKSDGH